MKYKLSFSVIFWLLASSLMGYAQNSFEEEFRKFKQQASGTYSSFRKECNDKYIEFMKKSWEHFQSEPGIPKPAKDTLQPVVYVEPPVPVAPVESQPEAVRPELPARIVKAPAITPQPAPIETIVEKPVSHKFPFEFSFYGTKIKIDAAPDLRFKLISTLKDDVAESWAKLSGGEYDNLVLECLKLRSEYKLCDWGYLQMILAFTDKFLTAGNESILLAAYLYSQSGYQMRLGLSKGALTLLFGSEYQIYDFPYYPMNGYYFYQVNGRDAQMDIVNYSFKDEKPLSMAINSTPALTELVSDVHTFKSPGNGGSASCTVNMNLLKFYSLYPSSQRGNDPLTRWALYANSPLDESVSAQLYPSLKASLEGKNETESVSLLLNFVQTAFKYGVDEDLWGKDRVFFCEETLHYPSSDCEDRAVLFSRLVRDLTDLDVVLLYYPGHLASAVKFSSEVPGDSFSVGENRYVVCDPCYVNAPIGKSMPKLDSSQAQIIVLSRH